jgi:hypothetical protein
MNRWAIIAIAAVLLLLVVGYLNGWELPTWAAGQ